MAQSSASISWIGFFSKSLTALLALAIILLCALPIGFYGMAIYIAPSLPSLTEIKTAKVVMPLQIYTHDDKLIGQYGNTMSLPVKYEEIPKNMVNAFLAAEDKTFFQHTGVSVKGMGRALTEAVSEDEGQTGGSTITMQVAKNYFLSSERTLNRKLTEIFLARKLEEQLTKEEILTLYVNKIYLGQGAYGIRAAAKQYYSKSLENLTLAEMAMLAGLPKAPSKYNPVVNPQRAMERRNWILGEMLRTGSITQDQYKEAINAPNDLHPYQVKLDTNMPFLAEMARNALVTQYGEGVMDSGWRVRLTVDSNAQELAERAVKRGLFAYDRRHGWRGAEGNVSETSLDKFKAYGSLYPAEVTKVGSGFEAKLQDGTKITIPASGMSWATYHYRSENSMYVSNNIVKVGDIVHVSQNPDSHGWTLVQVPKIEGSLVSLEPDTGALKAVVGGFDFNKSKFNRAIQGYRQPGSTIKPLIYTAALEKGFRPDTLVSDGPLKIGSWTPKNSEGTNLGMIPLRKGLYLSRNLVSIRVLRSTGIPDTRNLLDQFGLDKDQMPTTLSLALGSGEATPMQMATAYATFANGGHRIQPYFIDQIYDYNNKLIYQANPLQACAICFNQNLEKINADSQKSYEEAEKNKQTSIANGENLTAKTPDKTDDLLNDNPIAKHPEDKKSKKADKKSKTDARGEPKLSKEEQALADQNKQVAIRMANLRSELYNAGPDVDRLHAPPTQYIAAQQAPRIISPINAYEMAGMLRDVIQRGTATKAKALGRNDIGGKTGTTNDAKDAWFAGIHPTLVSTVWVGFDQPTPLGRREFGGIAALPIWMDYTGKMLKNTPVQWVSTDNKAKSKKQAQKTIELTDKGTKTGSTDDSNPDNDGKPPRASIHQRPAEKPSASATAGLLR